ncbi:MAG: hypothetical protein KDA17_05340, partial [Candidatus Saccharibacteria bacterium]|nr:hypothetical protein [Candidatus Saccharibacteria bacterium]
IDTMSYKTLRQATSTGNPIQVAAYVLYVDLDGDTATTNDQTYYVYEPAYNGTVQTGVWQTWDVLQGGNSKWWGNGSGVPNQTWSAIVATHPAALALAYGFNQGLQTQVLIHSYKIWYLTAQQHTLPLLAWVVEVMIATHPTKRFL